jgi:hypothetical protein
MTQKAFGRTLTGISDGAKLTEDDHAGIRSGARILYCFGRVMHRPARAQGIHTTAFCRKLELRPNASVDDHGRFRLYNDPDYEYQDWLERHPSRPFLMMGQGSGWKSP